MSRRLIFPFILLIFIIVLCSCVPLKKSTEQGADVERETVVKSQGSFQFAVLGDSKILPDRPQWKGNAILAKLVQRINQDNPDLVIYLGDGPDEGGPISNMVSFREMLGKLKSPWYPAIGNHEIIRGAGKDGNRGDGESNYLEVFNDKLPVDFRGNRVSYYSFNYRNSHFIVLDTAWQERKDGEKYGLYPGSTQWEWLVQDLKSSQPGCKHIFIFGHEPPLIPYKSGGENDSKKLSDLYGTTWNNYQVVESFVQLCHQQHVDAVFSGHIHAYLNFKDGEVTHIITGDAGASLYAPPELGGLPLCEVYSG